MTTTRKLRNIPRSAPSPRAGFHSHGDLETRADVIAFIEGYAARMRSLSHNPNIPRAQCRVAQENARLGLRLLNAVRQRSEKDLIEKPLDVFAELDALREKDADETGVAPESADLEGLDFGANAEE